MILIGQYDSPFVRRVAIALRLYGLPFEHRPWSTFGDGDKIAPYNPLRRGPGAGGGGGGGLSRGTAGPGYFHEGGGPGKGMSGARGAGRGGRCEKWGAAGRGGGQGG